MVFNLFILILGYITFGFIAGAVLTSVIDSIKEYFRMKAEEKANAAFEKGENHERE